MLVHGFDSDDYIKVWFNAKKLNSTTSLILAYVWFGLKASFPAALIVTICLVGCKDDLVVIEGKHPNMGTVVKELVVWFPAMLV